MLHIFKTVISLALNLNIHYVCAMKIRKCSLESKLWSLFLIVKLPNYLYLNTFPIVPTTNVHQVTFLKIVSGDFTVYCLKICTRKDFQTLRHAC